MLEKNSHKFIWTVGAIAVAVLVILGIRQYVPVFMTDASFKAQTVGDNQVSTFTSDMLELPSNGKDTVIRQGNQVSAPASVADYTPSTNVWAEPHSVGLFMGSLGIKIPYHATVSILTQVYVTARSDVASQDFNFDASNQYTDGTADSWNDLDRYEHDDRYYYVNDKKYSDDPNGFSIPVPTNQWVTLKMVYTNNSGLKKSLTDESDLEMLSPLPDKGDMKITWRNLAYSVSN